jgi:hypothetical protein
MITFPVHMFVGTSDRLVAVKDAKKAFDEMTMSVGKTFNSYDIGILLVD